MDSLCPCADLETQTEQDAIDVASETYESNGIAKIPNEKGRPTRINFRRLHDVTTYFRRAAVDLGNL